MIYIYIIVSTDGENYFYFLNFLVIMCRAAYCDVFLDSLVNWEFVESQIPSDGKEL